MILAEPTDWPDFAHYTEFLDVLRQVNTAGTTVVLITHDMHLALEYTERVLVLSGGRLLADEHPAVVLTDPGLAARADLVTTGLHELARRCGIAEGHTLVRRFVAADRAAREVAPWPRRCWATSAVPAPCTRCPGCPSWCSPCPWWSGRSSASICAISWPSRPVRCCCGASPGFGCAISRRCCG